MIDYRVRGYRRFPQKPMRQIVIYLQKINSPKVYQTTFALEETLHRFEVIRLWEQPTEIFLRIPGLLPFAVLSNTDDKINTLQQVATAINKISDRDTQSNLIASSFILAGLVLEKEVVQRLLRRDDIMRESSTYQLLAEEIEQEIQERVRQEVQERVRQEVRQEVQERVRQEVQERVRQENVRLLGVNMLKEGFSIEIVAKITGLTIEQVQQLQITAVENHGN